MFEGQGERGQFVVTYDGGDWGKIDGLDGSGRSLRLGLSFALYGHRMAARHVIGVMGHIGLWSTLDWQGWGAGSIKSISPMLGSMRRQSRCWITRLNGSLVYEVGMTLAGKLGLGLGAGLGREAGEDGFDGGVHDAINGFLEWSAVLFVELDYFRGSHGLGLFLRGHMGIAWRR